MNPNDIKVVGAGVAGYLTSVWGNLEPILQAIIIIATAGYVVLRLWKEVKQTFFDSSN